MKLLTNIMKKINFIRLKHVLLCLPIFIVIYYIIIQFFSLYEGNQTMDDPVDTENEENSNFTRNAKYYDPTVNDKIIDLDADIATTEQNAGEKWGIIDSKLESIQMFIDNIIIRDKDIQNLIDKTNIIK